MELFELRNLVNETLANLETIGDSLWLNSKETND